MKVRYPEVGWLPDDLLDPGSNLTLTMRNVATPMCGELLGLQLAKRKVPRLLLLPAGSPNVVEVPISKIQRIEATNIDLANSDYSDDDPDEYDRWEPT